MNSSQFLSLVRWLLNALSGGVIAYTAAKSPAVQGVGAYVAQLITGPDVVSAGVLGVTWLWGHLTHSSSPPSGSGGASKAGGIAALLVALGVASCALGCAPLQKNADPIVVRAEQSIAIANSTFDTVVHLDQADRNLSAAKAPKFHAFCEWLRTPVIIAPLTNSFPRGLAIVRSADLVKEKYKSTRSTNDYALLISSLAVVESATVQAQQLYSTAITTIK